jgi:hypothetical protein
VSRMSMTFPPRTLINTEALQIVRARRAPFAVGRWRKTSIYSNA